jgi:hypothetical protein
MDTSLRAAMVRVAEDFKVLYLMRAAVNDTHLVVRF